MSNTISQLKSIWNKEKESYKTQEVGSGVQRFVKNVLECTDIFNLKEGNLSTPKENRKNEFIHEKRTKDRRRADFDIFISSDIEIPLEAEQYCNIEQGEGQLFRYQSDLQKKYGILTDGYTWRFYNNNICIKVFTLEHLLSQTDYFLNFWKEYIKPEYYYLSFFEEIGQLSLFGKEVVQVADKRQLFFQDVTTLIRGFRYKLRIEGYFNGLEKREAEKKATEISYAYIIQFILYKTLVDNKFEDFENDYKSRIETICNAIKNHSYKEILGTIDGISELISQNIYRPFAKEQEYIRSKLLRLFRSARNELSDVSPWLDIVVFIKKYNFRNVRNEIFGFVYENYLKELYGEEKRGQYFTDSSVVRFMLRQIGYTATKIRGKIKAGELDKLSIIDPACGSGTFLYSATDEIIKSFSQITDETSKQIEEIVTNNAFGLDVEEFPLYLAEMNILMRMLPLIMGEKYNNPLDKKIKVFWTKDSIAEFIGSELISLGTQISFPETIIKPKFESFVRSEEDLTEMKGSMTSIPRRRFDYVIANPPYVSYNECSKQGLLIFQLLKKQVHLNNIFGVNLHSIPSNHKRYAPKPNLYAFFLALGLVLLKDDGRLCYIIPQTILTTGDLDVLRYHLAKHVAIEKIITFNRNLFIERGLKQKRIIPTSSLIIVVGKQAPSKTHEVEIINYKGGEDTIEDTLNNILLRKEIDTRKVKQSELLENVTNWNFIKQDNTFLDFCSEYESNTVPMSIYYEHDAAEKKFGNRFYFDGGGTIETKLIVKNPIGAFEIFDYKRNNYQNYLVSRGNQFYPKTGKVAFPQGSQGIATFHQKYKIVWRTKAIQKFQFTQRPILLINNQSLVIASNSSKEIVYLLALLDSPITRLLLEGNLKQEHEKDFLVSIKAIKNYVRVPQITPKNRHIKKEIIERTEQALALEEKTLSDFVDFSDAIVQKLDDVQVVGDTLVLAHDGQKTELSIKGDTELVARTIAERFETGGLKLEKSRISLSDLRNLQVIDFEKQAKLKDYIDDLVFALCFKIPLKDIGLDNAEETQKACSRSKYYKLL